MIFSLLFLSIASACVGPRLEDRSFELEYEYSYENYENPMKAKGIAFSNVYHADLHSCLDAASEAYLTLKNGETDGFKLVRLKLACRNLRTNFDYLFLER